MILEIALISVALLTIGLGISWYVAVLFALIIVGLMIYSNENSNNFLRYDEIEDKDIFQNDRRKK